MNKLYQYVSKKNRRLLVKIYKQAITYILKVDNIINYSAYVFNYYIKKYQQKKTS